MGHWYFPQVKRAIERHLAKVSTPCGDKPQFSGPQRLLDVTLDKLTGSQFSYL